MQVNIPVTVTWRYYHSLSVWSVTPTTNWIIVFGGIGVYTDTQVIELSKYMYTVVDTMSRNFIIINWSCRVKRRQRELDTLVVILSVSLSSREFTFRSSNLYSH